MSLNLDPEEPTTQGPVIRDKRRIDPVTGQVREQPAAAPATSAEPAGSADESAALAAELAERTADLQRLQAEYVNYKRRVDRERENTRKTAVASTLGALLPVLDDIARAREHEELTGGFKAVAESLERTISSLGLTTYGEVGDPFDPRIHEALMHSYSDDVTGPVCQAILQVGYRLDDRIVRPARVAVAEPNQVEPSSPVAADEAGTDTGGGPEDADPVLADQTVDETSYDEHAEVDGSDGRPADDAAAHD